MRNLSLKHVFSIPNKTQQWVISVCKSTWESLGFEPRWVWPNVAVNYIMIRICWLSNQWSLFKNNGSIWSIYPVLLLRLKKIKMIMFLYCYDHKLVLLLYIVMNLKKIIENTLFVIVFWNHLWKDYIHKHISCTRCCYISMHPTQVLSSTSCECRSIYPSIHKCSF